MDKKDKIKVVGHLKGTRGFEMGLNDGHTLITDTSVENGGQNLGPSPKQLLLSSLIGCIGIDVTMILEKKKIQLEDLDIEAEAVKTDTMPQEYENIHLTFKARAEGLKKEVLEDIVALSKEKYCGVSAMLEKVTPITYEVIIL